MDVKEATKMIDEHYPEHLTYRGNEFFDKIYMGIFQDFAAKELRIGDTEEVDAGYEGEETGEWMDDTEKQTIDGQESYLGYLADEDVFVEGFDMFDSGAK